MFEFLITIII